MTNSDAQWFDTTVRLLSDPHNQRVWSIIISLFGDMAQQPNDQISGGALTRIITPMGIKPEAIRVALHRLRKDGWIESARSGRASIHYLTQYGRDLSAAVTPQIYAHDPAPQQSMHVLIADDGAGQTALQQALKLPNYIAVNRNTALGFGAKPDTPETLLAFDAANFDVPEWLKTRLYPTELSQICGTLLQALDTVPGPPPALEAAQIATLRALIVHRWRRVVLRRPDLPASFHPTDWPGDLCRQRVFALLDLLSRPNLAALNQAPQR